MNAPRKSVRKNIGISLVLSELLKQELLFLEKKNQEWKIDLIEIRRRAEIIVELKKRADFISDLVTEYKRLDAKWEENDNPYGAQKQSEASKQMVEIGKLLELLWYKSDGEPLENSVVQAKVSKETSRILDLQQKMSF